MSLIEKDLLKNIFESMDNRQMAFENRQIDDKKVFDNRQMKGNNRQNLIDNRELP